MRRVALRHAVLPVLTAALLSVPASAKAADTQLPQLVTMVIGSAAGGGFDQYGRLTARHLGKHLPGTPTIVVQNMPGAGGIKSLNWLYNTAAKDGKHFALISAAASFAPLMVDRPLPYDPPKFTYLIRLNPLNNMLLVWHNTPFHTSDQVFKQEMILGNSSGPSAIIPAMMNRLVGTKFKVIGGYNGTNGMAMALETGEVQGSINYEWDSITGSRKDWLNGKKIRIIMQMTMEPVDDPLLKGIPYIGQYVSDPEARHMLEMLLAKQKLGRSFMGPPNLPAEITKIYRTALTATVKDPAYLKAAEAGGISLDPISGEELAAFMTRIYSIPKATVDKMREEIKLAEKGILKRKGSDKKKKKKAAAE